MAPAAFAISHTKPMGLEENEKVLSTENKIENHLYLLASGTHQINIK